MVDIFRFLGRWFGKGIGLFLLLVLSAPGIFAQTAPAVKNPTLTSWKVVRKKTFPNYKVEILERWTMGKFPRVDSMKARIIPTGGGSVTEYSGTWLTPDPKEYVSGWKAGQVLDMTGDGLEDLMLRNSTGGAHCCYSYTIFSLVKPLKRIGDIKLKDCGEKIQLRDLNGNGKPEVISCDAKFTYLGDLPYSESPFPPAVYTLGLNGYERADRAFKQVYLDDIAKQRETLKKAYKPAAALQITADYFLMGDEKKGWEEFESLYQGADKEKIKLQLLQKLGLSVSPAPIQPVPAGAATPAPPAQPGLP